MYKHDNYVTIDMLPNTSAPIVDTYDLLYLNPISKPSIPTEVSIALDKAMKSNCFDLCPELTSHDNVWFWIGFNKAVEIMKKAYLKK